MLTPFDVTNLEILDINYDVIEHKIDNSIKRFHGTYAWETAIIDGEIPLAARNKLAEKYHKAGWNYVYHRTTSENGERYGLTSFMFSKTPIDDKYLSNYTAYENTSGKNRVLLTPDNTYVLPIANGELELMVINDEKYPGLDIEFTMKDESQNYITKPRILIEAPVDDETNIQQNLSAMLWAGAYTEDYTDKVVFTNRQLCKNQRTKLSFTDEIGFTEFQVYTEWLNAQPYYEHAAIYHLAAEDPNVSGLIS